MQDLHDGDLEGAGPAGSEEAGRVLEDPREVAQSHRLVFRAGRHRQPPKRYELDTYTWYHCQLEYLEWRPLVAMALLEGALLTNLMPRGYVLLNGVHRPAWHPRPGIEDVDLAFFPWVPTNIPPVELMVRLAGYVRRP